MSNQAEQNKLNEIVANQARSSKVVADAFIQQLFTEIEKELISNSFVKIKGLGLFRVIKSGDKQRILYLGSKDRLDEEFDFTGISHSIDNNINGEGGTTDRSLSENIEFEPEHYNDRSANELFETFEQRYGQSPSELPINNGQVAVQAKASQQPDYTYIANRKMNLIKTCIIALAILLIASIGYIALSGASPNPDQDELESDFHEVENSDTLAFNRVIIPQVDVSIQYIARIYYGDDIYWPYVFMANKESTNKNMVIRGGTKIRIPRIAVDLAGLHDGTVQNSVKSLAKDIISVENK